MYDGGDGDGGQGRWTVIIGDGDRWPRTLDGDGKGGCEGEGVWWWLW